LSESDDFGDEVGVSVSLNSGLTTALGLGLGVGRGFSGGVSGGVSGGILLNTRFALDRGLISLGMLLENLTQLLLDVLGLVKESLNKGLLVRDSAEKLESEVNSLGVKGSATIVRRCDELIIMVDEEEAELNELTELGGKTRSTLLLGQGDRGRCGHF